ncbi:hypothetical protein [Luteolibacter soli]|uniref:Serine/threonine protein kinase n=1 Tax=Luteolibacter soli TaxID=3135280 RepID=A0ABU9AVA7_9BACT
MPETLDFPQSLARTPIPAAKATQTLPTPALTTPPAPEQVIHGVDLSGQVYFAEGRVFRIIRAEGAPVVRRIMEWNLFEALEKMGVVRTWVSQDAGSEIVLEHERIPFVTHPAEWTPQMVREAARFLVTLNLKLRAHGLMLKDAHLLNVTFHRGKPVFLDFGSIVRFDRWLSKAWLKGFRSSVLTAVWIGRWKGAKLASAMLQSEPRGMGYELSKVFPLNLVPVSGHVAIFLARIGKWEAALRFLEKRLRPKVLRSPYNLWNDYGTAIAEEEKQLKRKVIYDEVRRSRPASLHELAGNQAVIGEQIVRELGIPVCSTDYVSHCVQQAWERTRGEDLPLQVGVVDLLFPVSPCSIGGSSRPGAMERLQAETTLATALVHHLVALKETSMDGFVAILAAYSEKSTIVEWVDPSDKYLKFWKKDGKRFPEDYTEEGFLAAFGKVFPFVRELPRHHEHRKLFHFSRVPFEGVC